MRWMGPNLTFSSRKPSYTLGEDSCMPPLTSHDLLLQSPSPLAPGELQGDDRSCGKLKRGWLSWDVGRGRGGRRRMGSGSGSRVGKPSGVGKDLPGAIPLTRRNEGQVTSKYSTGRSSTSSQVATTRHCMEKKDFSSWFSVWVNDRSCGSWKLLRAASAQAQQGLLLNACNEPEPPQLCFSKAKEGERRYSFCGRNKPRRRLLYLFFQQRPRDLFYVMVLSNLEQEGSNGVGAISDPSGKVVDMPLALGEGLKMGNREANGEMRMEKGTQRSSPALPSSLSSQRAPGSSVRFPSPTGN